MGAFLTWPGGTKVQRYIRLDHARVNVAKTLDMDVVSIEARAGVTLAAAVAGWLTVSTDGGATWTPVGDEPQTGVSLGAFTAGERKSIKLRLLVPLATVSRGRLIELKLGIGTS